MKYPIVMFFLITSIFLRGQTAIKMEKQGGIFVLPCKVNGLNLKFIMDTGASDVSISLAEAIFMLKNDYMSEDDLIGTTYYQIADGNVMEGTEIILREIEIGGKKLYNVKASISHSLSAPLLLGQSALSKLGKIQVDYSNNTLVIGGPSLTQPSKEPAQPQKQDTAHFDSDDDGVPDHLDNCPYEKGDPKNNGCVFKKTDIPVMVFVKGGTFQMGGDFGESDEKPIHSVTLNDFHIGRFEVTFDEYDTYCAATGETQPDDKGWGRGKRPVINVSWNKAVAYCNWRSEQEGLSKVYNISDSIVTAYWYANGYRLPTEAEWECAARSRERNDKWAGTSNESSLSIYANGSSSGDSYQYTAPVGSFHANALGLNDMSGNVNEWCWDWKADYSPDAQTNPCGTASGSGYYSGRIFRGGSWSSDQFDLRTTNRSLFSPHFSSSYIGFRLVRAVN